MPQTSEQLSDSQAHLELGTVTRAVDDHLMVDARGSYRATRATSCLLEPIVGDRVLVCTDQAGSCHVLAVLSRAEDGGVVSLPGEMKLSAEQITLQADVARTEATRIEMQAESGDLELGELSYAGRLVRAQIGTVRSVVGAIDTVAERVSQRAKRAYKWIEELEMMRAERVDYQAKGTLNMRAKNAVVMAEQVVKIDGGQVHLG